MWKNSQFNPESAAPHFLPRATAVETTLSRLEVPLFAGSQPPGLRQNQSSLLSLKIKWWEMIYFPVGSSLYSEIYPRVPSRRKLLTTFRFKCVIYNHFDLYAIVQLYH